mmetsp:Transcript_58691/g.171758  ORF Transcript_58691/g.171758 Transcript_58691/m.171758 type:complete len:441 (-) Transcript_58691:310-1632(-)
METPVAVVNDDAVPYLSIVELWVRERLAKTVGQEDRVRVSLDQPVVVLVSASPLDLVPDRDEDRRVQVRAPGPSLPHEDVHLQLLRPDAVAEVHGDVAKHSALLASEDSPMFACLAPHEALLLARRQHQGVAVQRAPRQAEGGRRLGRGQAAHLLPGPRFRQAKGEQHVPLVAGLRGVAELHLQPAAGLSVAPGAHAVASSVLDEALRALQVPVLAQHPGLAGPEVHHAARLLPLGGAQAAAVLGHDPAHSHVYVPLLPVQLGVSTSFQEDLVAVPGHAETVAALDLEARRIRARKPRGACESLEARQLQLSLQVAPLPRALVPGVGLAPGPGGAVPLCTAVCTARVRTVNIPDGVEVAPEVVEVVVQRPADAGAAGRGAALPVEAGQPHSTVVALRGIVFATPMLLVFNQQSTSRLLLLLNIQGVHPYVACTVPGGCCN